MSTNAVISDDFKHIALPQRNGGTIILSQNLPKWDEVYYPDHLLDEVFAFSPDAQWLLAGKRPNTFHILKVSAAHTVIELESPDSGDVSSRPWNSTAISCKIWTRFSMVGLGKQGELEKATRIGWGVNLDMEWIMRGNEYMIWVPHKWRDLAVDTHGSRIAFAHLSGEILMMQLERND
jgi:hypothetical protein